MRAALNDHLSKEPVRIRGHALRVLPRARAIIALTLPLCVASAAAAEEPNSRADCCTAPEVAQPSAPEAPEASTEQEVSEAPPAEAQGATTAIFDVHVAPRPRLDAPPVETAERTPPPSAQPSTGAPASAPLLGVRFPAFIAFGIGSLGAGGAVVTRLVAAAPYTDPKLGCNGRCADGSHSLGLTSTILAGLAVGAVGTGVVLVLSEPAREKKPLAPVLKMSVSPSKAAASASWAF